LRTPLEESPPGILLKAREIGRVDRAPVLECA